MRPRVGPEAAITARTSTACGTGRRGARRVMSINWCGASSHATDDSRGYSRRQPGSVRIRSFAFIRSAGRGGSGRGPRGGGVVGGSRRSGEWGTVRTDSHYRLLNILAFNRWNWSLRAVKPLQAR